MLREISLDVETTGLSFADGDKIVEIGCVEMIDHIATSQIFHTYLNPLRNVPEEVVKIHGLDNDFLADKPVFDEIADDFLNFVKDSVLVIHNAQFDMGFINNELSLVNKNIISMDRVVDTLIIAKQKFPGDSKSLDALCHKFKIDNSARTKHGALLDAELLAEVYLQLIGGANEPALINLDDVAKEQEKNIEMVTQDKKVYREPRGFVLSELEIEKHKKFLAKMKNPVWK